MTRRNRIYILKQTDLDQVSRLLTLCHEGILDVFYRNCAPLSPSAPVNDDEYEPEDRLRQEINLLREQSKR